MNWAQNNNSPVVIAHSALIICPLNRSVLYPQNELGPV